MPSGVRSLNTVGCRLWLGLACGTVRVIDAGGAKPALLGHWHAHDAAVISIVQVGARMYSLGRDGAIKGWSAASPDPSDEENKCVCSFALSYVRKCWSQKGTEACSVGLPSRSLGMTPSLGFVRREPFAAAMRTVLTRTLHDCLAITWNVNEQRPEASALFRLVRERSAGAQLAMVALQEVEMGGGSVAIAAAKDAIARSLQACSPLMK